MQYDHFVGQVQHRAQLASSGEAVHAIRCTLQTLTQRLLPGEAHDLAAQLPREIGIYLERDPQAKVERLSLNDFFHRVSECETANLPAAVFHARVVIEVLCEAVSPGEIHDVLSELPEEYLSLFQAGSRGSLAGRK
jgi:uncharacterized protein (DUF2267 family)